MPVWAAKLHIMYADLSNVLFVNLMDTIKMMMMTIAVLLVHKQFMSCAFSKYEISHLMDHL